MSMELSFNRSGMINTSNMTTLQRESSLSRSMNPFMSSATLVPSFNSSEVGRSAYGKDGIHGSAQVAYQPQSKEDDEDGRYIDDFENIEEEGEVISYEEDCKRQQAEKKHMPTSTHPYANHKEAASKFSSYKG